MFIRRLYTFITAFAVMFVSGAAYAQDAQKTDSREFAFNKDNPYTQLIPQPKSVTYDLNAKPFVLDKNTVILCENPFI